MSDLEEEMRRALFGNSAESGRSKSLEEEVPIITHPETKRRSPCIRVTLKVSKVFEGDTAVVVYDCNTLSTLTAEIEAKAAAKKKRFKYVDMVSIQSVE
ncbi:hypothetical protein ACTMQT_12165 [Pseudomonas syringae pv. aptata]|uniref:hypothetical protein n=1 Tax=Pseudomonas syringae TaxID=317 RepID=UPI003F8C2F1F